jgi:predicted nucleic acid-binding Zn ribbon protein
MPSRLPNRTTPRMSPEVLVGASWHHPPIHMSSPTPAASAAPSPPTPNTQRAIEPTHPCVRCGRRIPLDQAMCEFCNPLGLSQPATSQAHGTVFLAIAAGVVALAVIGRLALAGVGPFHASVANVAPTADGLAVTLTVRNDGTSEGSSTCRLTEASRNGTGPSAIVLTPHVKPGQSLTFTSIVSTLGTTVVPLAVECRSP